MDDIVRLLRLHVALLARAVLRAYSRGKVSRHDAIRRLGLRDHAQLLVALGGVGLPMPMVRPEMAETVEAEATEFERVWNA